MTQIGIGQIKGARTHEQDPTASSSTSSRNTSAASISQQTSAPNFNARAHLLPRTAQDHAAYATKARSNTNLESQASATSQEEGQLSVDILHKEDQMIIICPIAGVNKADINVAIQDDVLTIRGKRNRLPEMELAKPLVSELFWETFSRSIVLPDHIDRKKIEAKVHEHMLIVKIPKTEDFKTRIIHINETEWNRLKKSSF